MYCDSRKEICKKDRRLLKGACGITDLRKRVADGSAAHKAATKCGSRYLHAIGDGIAGKFRGVNHPTVKAGGLRGESLKKPRLTRPTKGDKMFQSTLHTDPRPTLECFSSSRRSKPHQQTRPRVGAKRGAARHQQHQVSKSVCNMVEESLAIQFRLDGERNKARKGFPAPPIAGGAERKE
jgi:hypothetical protein